MNSIPSGQGKHLDVIRVQRICRWTIVTCALISCWMCRFQMNPDGVSYLDMGDQYWKGNWRVALNPYWSPLYGWLTGLMFRVLKPSIRWEFPEVHLLNFVIFLTALFCFEFFWRELLASGNDIAWGGASRRHAWIMGYLWFAWALFGASELALVSPDELALVSPDLIVAAVVLVASGLMLRFMAGRLGIASAGLLGGVLGIGYLAKAAMFPFALIFILTMLAVAWKLHRRMSLVAATVLSFVLLSAPFAIALSRNQHRLTFGDSAKITQGWFVNGIKPNLRHWQGNSTGHVGAQHPTRKVLSWPEVYEFATPVQGTYPVWYNPAYWYAGLDSSVHLVRELEAFRQNLIYIFESQRGYLIAIAVIMFFLSGRIMDYGRRFISFWPILIPAMAVYLMYAMVHWEQRYTTGVMLVICGVVTASTDVLKEKRTTRLLRAASIMLSVVVVCWVLPIQMRYGYYWGRGATRQVVIAERLRTLGIMPGDNVALIGDGFVEYWARLEEVRIVAEVPNIFETGDSASAFWNSSPEVELAVLKALKNSGAKAVIAAVTPRLLPPGWVQIGDTGHAVYFLQ